MPTPKSKRTIVLQSSNHDSEFDSLIDAVADSQNESTESDGADTLLAGYYADNGFSDGKKLKQLRPLGQQLFSSQEESGETIPVASDITLTSEPPVVGKIITVTNTNDRGPGSLRNAVASLQDESTESLVQDILTGNGYSDDNNSLESGYRASLYGGAGEDFFNARSDTSSPLRLPPTNQSPGFTDAITDQLFSSGVSPVETTFTSISGNNTSFAVLLDGAHTNAAAKNDGAWRASGSTFETDSFGTPVSFAGEFTISGNNSSRVIL